MIFGLPADQDDKRRRRVGEVRTIRAAVSLKQTRLLVYMDINNEHKLVLAMWRRENDSCDESKCREGIDRSGY